VFISPTEIKIEPLAAQLRKEYAQPTSSTKASSKAFSSADSVDETVADTFYCFGATHQAGD
jgi:hypothetical protein